MLRPKPEKKKPEAPKPAGPIRLRPPKEGDDMWALPKRRKSRAEESASESAEETPHIVSEAPEPGVIAEAEIEAPPASPAAAADQTSPVESDDEPELIARPDPHPDPEPGSEPEKKSLNPFARFFGSRKDAKHDAKMGAKRETPPEAPAVPTAAPAAVEKATAPAAKEPVTPAAEPTEAPAAKADVEAPAAKADAEVPAPKADVEAPSEKAAKQSPAAKSKPSAEPVVAAAAAPSSKAAAAPAPAAAPASRPGSTTPHQLPGLVPTYLIHNLPESIFLLDEEGRVLWMNAAAEQLTGYAFDDLKNQSYPVLLAPTDRKRVARFFARQHLRNREQSHLDTPLVTRDGHSAWVGLNVKRMFAPDGAIRYVACAQDLHHLHFELESLGRKTKELAALADEAQAAAQLKGDFLATMSHEIRTPMNGVIGMSHLILESNLDREQRTYAEVIHNSSMALLTLINDILDFSKIEAGKLDIETLDFDLRVAVHGVVALLAPNASNKGLNLTVAVGHDVPSRLKGDPGRLRQVLLNLAGNAIKFTESGEVAIRVERLEETANQVMLRFSITDTGIGMTSDQMTGLFRAFQQADPSIARRFGGTGLGLAISQRLVKLMGGEVGVKSEAGQGSTFWFELPYEKQPELSDTPPAPRVSLAGLRVLVVDPVRNQRQALVEMLESWGCAHAQAETGEAALTELIRAQREGEPYRAAMIDMQTPTLGGDVLGRKIKAEKGLENTLMLLLTNLGRRGDALRAQQAGFSAYLLKPVQQSHLYDALVEVVSTGDAAAAAPGAQAAAPLVTRHTVTEHKRNRMRVLLVEDNPVNQFVAASALRRFGYQADMASEGARAVELASKNTYDIIFMDIQMPRMDGYQCTAELRALEAGGQRTPIIAMTAHALPGDRERCLAAGMDDYLTKPIDLEELCSMVEKWVSPEKRGASREEGDQIGPAAGTAPEDKGRVELIGTVSHLHVPDLAPSEPQAAAPPAGLRARFEGLVSRMMGASAQPAEPPVIEKPVGTPPEPQDRTLAQRAADELGRLKSERVSAKDEAESDSAASPGRGAESDRPAKAAKPEAGEGRKPSSKRAPDDLVVLGPEQIEPDASGESGSKPAAEPTTAEPVATKESAPANSEPAASKSEPAPAKSEPPAPKREAAPVAAHSADAAPPPSAAPASTPPAAPQLPVNPGIVDESVPVIDEIRFDASSMGRPELRQVLAKTFLKHARKRIIRIEEMLLASDAQGVEFEAHGMKGMCLTLGAARCVKLFHDMELLARAGELDSLKPVLKRLKMETERVEAHLSKFDQAA